LVIKNAIQVIHSKTKEYQTMKKTIITVLVAGVLAGGALIGLKTWQTVQAATDPQAATGMLEHRGPGGSDRWVTNEDLAGALGISVDELTAAQQSATKAAVQQAVDADLLTQTQADRILANLDGDHPFGGMMMRGWFGQDDIDYDALLADALGISTDELQAARQEAVGIAVDRTVTDGDLTAEQADLIKGQIALHSSSDFQTAMQSAFESAVNAAVQSGVITQAQADQILAARQNRGGMGPGMPGLFGSGGRHGRHGGMPGMRWSDED
jgi:hypothetical protein